MMISLISLGLMLTVPVNHPSSSHYPIQGRGGAGAYPSCQRVRRSTSTAAGLTHRERRPFVPTASLRLPINRAWMSVGGSRSTGIGPAQAQGEHANSSQSVDSIPGASCYEVTVHRCAALTWNQLQILYSLTFSWNNKWTGLTWPWNFLSNYTQASKNEGWCINVKQFNATLWLNTLQKAFWNVRKKPKFTYRCSENRQRDRQKHLYIFSI